MLCNQGFNLILIQYSLLFDILIIYSRVDFTECVAKCYTHFEGVCLTDFTPLRMKNGPCPSLFDTNIHTGIVDTKFSPG